MTSFLLLDIILVATIVVAGFAIGWCACWYRAQCRRKHDDNERKLTQQILSDLRAVIDDVSADVGHHEDCIAEVDEGLAVAVTEETRLVASALTKLVTANDRMRQRLASAEVMLEDQSRVIETHATEARTDSLTQLVNRRAFDNEINRCFAAYRRQGRIFSVVLLDLDHFKQWNDCFGHPSGDRMLKQVAAILEDSAREMDLVARYGGEEFALILPGTPLADAVVVAQRVRMAMANAKFEWEEEQATMTLSAGAAQVGPDDSVTTLITRADTALYESKKSGRNRVYFHDGATVQSTESLTENADNTEQNGQEEGGQLEAVSSNEDPSDNLTSDLPSEVPEPAFIGPHQEGEEHPYLCARAEFRMTVSRRLAEWHRGGSNLSVVLVRVDDYQSTVDEYGFDVEPCMRGALWHLISSATRDMDLIGLYDQETFAMLLPRADRFAAGHVAERLREAVVSRSLATPNGLLQFTVSTGVAEAIEGDQAEQLLKRADDALLAAVASGGNNTYLHDGSRAQACKCEIESVA